MGFTGWVLFAPAHFATGAQLLASVGAMLAGVALVGVWAPRARLHASALAPIIALMLALLVAGRWLGGTWTDSGWTPGVPRAALALLLASPGALAIAGCVRRPRVLVYALPAGAVLAMSGVGALLAFGASPDQPARHDPYADFDE